MNRRIFHNFSECIGFCKVLSIIVLLNAACLFSACATKPPLRTDMHTLVVEPGAYDNQRIELAGQVIDYEPARGDTYRTLHFTLGSGPEEKISVFCSGYEADAIAKASAMVGEAFQTGGILVVIGKLKAGDGGQAAMELILESVEYEGRSIDVSRGQATRGGFDMGGFHIMPSIGIDATFSP